MRPLSNCGDLIPCWYFENADGSFSFVWNGKRTTFSQSTGKMVPADQYYGWILHKEKKQA